LLVAYYCNELEFFLRCVNDIGIDIRSKIKEVRLRSYYLILATQVC
jgi:hypothetical protein